MLGKYEESGDHGRRYSTGATVPTGGGGSHALTLTLLLAALVAAAEEVTEHLCWELCALWKSSRAVARAVT